MTLADYVTTHTIRGACTCGRCADAPANPGDLQPTGHTADLMFFSVARTHDPDPATFKALVAEELPVALNGCEHGYMELGGLMGDQGLALLCMGLGALLGTWELLTPRSVLGKLGLSEGAMMDLAGRGMVTIVHRKENTL